MPLPVLTTQRDLAALFGVSVQTISVWVSRGMPRKKKGKRWVYELGPIVQWRRKEDLAQASEGDTVRKEWQTRALAAKAQLQEMELARAHGELVDPEALLGDFLGALQILKQEFRRLETHMGETMTREEYADTWREMWDRARERVRRADEAREKARKNRGSL